MARFESVFVVFFLIIVAFGGEPDDDTQVLTYTKESFDAQLETGPHFVLFYAPWCAHCKNVMPTWKKLMEKYSSDEKVKIIQVDCVKNTDVCASNNVLGYPTMKFFGEHGADPVVFKGGRNLETFEEFIKKHVNSDAQEPQIPEPVVKTGLYELTEATFAKHVELGDHFIKFYAPWCGHCQRLAPTWADLATYHDENYDVKIAKVDCTENRPLCQKQGVNAYPTLLWFRGGASYEKYQGARDLESLRRFIKEKVAEKAAASQTEDAEKIPDAKVPLMQENVVRLNSGNFETSVASGTTFIKFYVDWCSHCKALTPIFEDLGKSFQESGSAVKIAEVNCDDTNDICRQYNVQGFPTILLFRDGKQIAEYEGTRRIEDFKQFLAAHAAHDEL